MAHIEPARFEDGRPMVIVGLSERYTPGTAGDIPSLWRRLAPHLGRIQGHVDHVAYGVVSNMAGADGGFDYMAGVEVSDADALPGGFASISIPAHRYAVFAHGGRVSKLKDTIGAIWNEWLPASGYKTSTMPGLLERYGERFNPGTGLGDIEVWVPVLN
jgi:AraC family transcriptional regulator